MRGNYFKQFVLGQPMMLTNSASKALEEILNSEIPKIQDGIETANNSVKYSTIQDIAIISIDGGMYKKNMSAMCISVASYDVIVKYIDKAEDDNSINTILFRVDTPGGFVAGADEVRERIYTSPKKTITLFENLGASGGMWVFTASDELFATPVTDLGSIGVKVAFELDDDSKTITIVSKNAKNKTCNMNEGCADRIQSKINETEDEFFRVMEENTGFNKESLVELFNEGDTIKAEIAQKAGFIKEVLHFKPLINRLTKSKLVVNTAVPTAQMSDKPAEINQKGETMFKDSDEYKQLVASHEEQVMSAKSTYENSLKEEKAKFDVFMKELPEIVAMGMSMNASKETMISMVTAGSLISAKVVVADSMQSKGAFRAKVDDEDKKDESSKKEKEVEARAKALGVQFIK
jgi:ClpP class serine protease